MIGVNFSPDLASVPGPTILDVQRRRQGQRIAQHECAVFPRQEQQFIRGLRRTQSIPTIRRALPREADPPPAADNFHQQVFASAVPRNINSLWLAAHYAGIGVG